MDPIPYGRQNITAEDIEAVIEVLQSDMLTQGPAIAEFEKAFAYYTDADFAVAVSNGTAALHLSVLAMGINPGDKVITTPITFAATANCIRYAGGEVVFCDIDPDSYLIDINELEKLLKAAPSGTYKGIIPVDFSGKVVDMESIRALSSKYGCWIIEDACHAPGGYFIDRNENKQLCGNGKHADLTVFSFHPVKHIACGEGGMVTTNDENLYNKLTMLRTHGITKDPDLLNEDHGGWYYEMHELGYNYRLTDIQAALGISQLKKAESGLKRRREIAAIYFNAFKNKSYILNQSGIIEGNAYHLYIIEVENRLGLYNYLREKSIYAQIHYIPVHLLPYYRKRGWKLGDFPVAEAYYQQCISLPMFPSLRDEELQYVIDSVKSFYE